MGQQVVCSSSSNPAQGGTDSDSDSCKPRYNCRVTYEQGLNVLSLTELCSNKSRSKKKRSPALAKSEVAQQSVTKVPSSLNSIRGDSISHEKDSQKGISYTSFLDGMESDFSSTPVSMRSFPVSGLAKEQVSVMNNCGQVQELRENDPTQSQEAETLAGSKAFKAGKSKSGKSPKMHIKSPKPRTCKASSSASPKLSKKCVSPNLGNAKKSAGSDVHKTPKSATPKSWQNAKC